MDTPLEKHDVTQLLGRIREGDKDALDRLMPIIYSELRRIAARHIARERPEHTLQPTALVNEAYLRFAEQEQLACTDRVHFLSVASQLIRHILIDHARVRNAEKRGGGLPKVELKDDLFTGVEQDSALLALNEALEALEKIDKQQSRIVELRFFGGLSIEETAEATGVSTATVKREWRLARAWLQREVSRGSTGEPTV